MLSLRKFEDGGQSGEKRKSGIRVWFGKKGESKKKEKNKDKLFYFDELPSVC